MNSPRLSVENLPKWNLIRKTATPARVALSNPHQQQEAASGHRW